VSTLSVLAGVIEARAGIVIGPDKLYLLEARLAPILHREGLATLDDLAGQIASRSNAALEQDIVEAVTTAETMFFRDAAPYQHLQTTALPRLLQQRAAGTKLRIWSAATATGQEAYSIAMMLAEHGLGAGQAEIIGTDLARNAIDRAAAGLYTQYEVQRGLPVMRLMEHFAKEGTEWRVKPGLRALCHFRQWNLLQDPSPLGQFDIVFCRNVLFYFNRAARARVLRLIGGQMAPGGLLYLGATETASGLDDTLERDGPAYQRRASPQLMAPRAAIGQIASTLPSRTPTYQS
jgi:chemotaxis protein methyltransferase CheR